MPGQAAPDAFTIERHGEVVAIRTSAVLETMEPTLMEGAGAILTDALRREKSPQIVVDLGPLDYFGSTFIGLLLRCYKLAHDRGGSMALCAVSDGAKRLLHATSLDMLWPIYGDLREAIDALQAD